MKLFSGIRQRIGEHFLLNRINEIVRFKEFNNLSTAKSVGVIFNATKLDAFYIARDFIVDLRAKGIAAHGMGYALTKEAAAFFTHNHEKYEKNIDVFSVGNINWYFKPNNPLTDAFCEKEFDILIDLSIGSELPLMFIVGLSRAKLKIGHTTSTNTYYDFTFRTADEPDPEYYLDQVVHYLDTIKVG